MVNWCQHVIFLDSINSYFDNNNTWFSCILVSMLLIFLMFGFRTGKILISHKHLKKVKNLELFLVDLLLMELFLIRYRPFFVFLDYLVLQVLLFFFLVNAWAWATCDVVISFLWILNREFILLLILRDQALLVSGLFIMDMFICGINLLFSWYKQIYV